METRKSRQRQPSRLIALTVALLAVVAPSTTSATSANVDLQVTVDARDMGRRIVHSTARVMRGDNALSVLYPKWIPGLHGPCGPIENVAGFQVSDQSGAAVAWQRDYADPFRFRIEDAASAYPLTVALTYVCGQPTTLSWGADCEGTNTLGVINWNAVTIYPEGTPVRDLTVEPRLVLPPDWQFATAMPVAARSSDTIVFAPVTYEELLDFPVICGLYLKTYHIASTPSAEYFVDVAVDNALLLPFADSAFTKSGWGRVVRETEAMFGRPHFDNYRFLVPISDSIGRYGLEHRNCSVNSNDPGSLRDYGKTRYSLQWILPHEFVHAWCGKYHRPAGMNTPDYQTPKDMELLWVYEGLTDYLGMVISARAGLLPHDYFVESLADYWGMLRHATGRSWRSLRDIEVATYTVWAGSDSWQFERLGAEYYPEGSLLWLGIDARLRELSGGSRSLDDFCRSFLGTADATAHSVPYTRDELMTALSELVAFNWDSLTAAWIDSGRDSLDESPLNLAGWQFDYVNQKPKCAADNEARTGCHYYYETLGLAVSNEGGRILQLVPGSPADRAGISTGMKLLGIDGRVFTFERLERALSESEVGGEISLLVQFDDLIQKRPLTYGSGLRYLCLRPLNGRRNWLGEIIAPAVETGLESSEEAMRDEAARRHPAPRPVPPPRLD